MRIGLEPRNVTKWGGSGWYTRHREADRVQGVKTAFSFTQFVSSELPNYGATETEANTASPLPISKLYRSTGVL